MRKANVFSETATLPRMSWSARNLYNLLSRSFDRKKVRMTNQTDTGNSMYKQRMIAKRLVRGYHGDHIAETKFKRWFLPVDLPSYANDGAAGSSQLRTGGILESIWRRQSRGEMGMPILSLFVRDLERRLDTAVFRCCFARSIYEARGLVVQGKVKLNGRKMTDPNRLLEPGDLLSVDAESIYMLSAEAEKLAKRGALEEAQQGAEGLMPAAAEEGEATQPSEAAVDVAAEASEATESASTDKEASALAPETEVETEAEAEKSEDAEAPSQSASTQGSEAADAQPAQGKKQQAHKPKVKEVVPLPEGVRPFHLPAFAAPFIFVPPYLEVSYSTCSAIYLRHPTITRHRRTIPSPPRGSEASADVSSRSRQFETVIQSDIPSPYSPHSDAFSLSWEHYVRNSPRVRSDVRRLKHEAKVGTNGHETARAADEWKKLLARRRGVTKSMGTPGRLSTTESIRRKGVRMRLMKRSKRSLSRSGSRRS
ncbi:unnamed protein product [Parajaminaea phylloscopi]